jgi:hypothetical protein
MIEEKVPGWDKYPYFPLLPVTGRWILDQLGNK